MLCSIGHGEFPDLNFRLAPSCNQQGKTSILFMNKPLKLPNTQFAFKPVFFFENIHTNIQSIIPKKGEISILENNVDAFDALKSTKKLFEVSNDNKHDTYSDTSTHEHSLDFSFNFITENNITKFELFKFPIFSKLLGNVPAFGTWSYTQLIVLIVVVTLFVALMSKLKFDEVIDGYVAGMSRAVRPALMATLVYVFVFLGGYHPILYTIIEPIMNISKSFNWLSVITLSISYF